MPNLDPYKSYESTETRRLQLIYLHYVLEESKENISLFTNYAVSTVKSYIYKFSYLLEEAKNLFKQGVVICNKIKNISTQTPKVYLFKFYDCQDNLLFSKIGTTKRKLEKRVREELAIYQKSFEIGTVVLESAFDCKDIPAEGAESFCRANFIKKYPNTFQSKDRFIKTDISVPYFNELVESYLTSQVAFCLWGAAAAPQPTRPKFTIIPYSAPFCQANFSKKLHKFSPKIFGILPLVK